MFVFLAPHSQIGSLLFVCPMFVVCSLGVHAALEMRKHELFLAESHIRWPNRRRFFSDKFPILSKLKIDDIILIFQSLQMIYFFTRLFIYSLFFF